MYSFTFATSNNFAAEFEQAVNKSHDMFEQYKRDYEALREQYMDETS